MILVAGEALIDLVETGDMRFEAKLGGSCFNLARALALLGAPTAFACPLSADPFGKRFEAQLTALGVDLLAATDVARPTAVAIVTVAPDGEPSYAFHRAGAADAALDPDAVAAALPAGLALAHIGSLAIADRRGFEGHRRIALAARAAGASIGLDPNVRPAAMDDLAGYRDRMSALMRDVDYLRLSDEDLAALGAVAPDADAPQLERAAEMLMRTTGVALLVLTLGADGALARTAQGAVARRPARPPERFVDAVGAGDALNAAILDQLARWDALSRDRMATLDAAALGRLLDVGATASGINCARRGAAPATRTELDAALGSANFANP